MKTAIVILSDPKNESEESLGRVFNGLASAYDFKNAGQDVSILFQAPVHDGRKSCKRKIILPMNCSKRCRTRSRESLVPAPKCSARTPRDTI